MGDQPITKLLRALSDSDPSAAWRGFLDQFSPLIQQVVVLFVNDPDSRADSFVYVCEQLADNNFRRLRKFDPDGDASFATWLRAVVHHLCIDWRRKNSGRFQPFAWVGTLSRIEQEAFRCLYAEGETVETTFAILSANAPGLTLRRTEEIAERLASRLTSRERWLLSTRRVRFDSIDEANEYAPALHIPDLSATPERAALDREWQKALEDALAELPPSERLLIQMRFEQDLTLAQIARLAGLKDAQTADRRIRAALETLRSRMTGFSARFTGKAKAASV